uniref:Uncharacterized protein n=1 Tax=Arsenophonus nasoniae TaxID=638 RepID=D2U1Y9_9GAMM|nr:hypothetical protein ARN_25860 [Arsenophonus nasoniae]
MNINLFERIYSVNRWMIYFYHCYFLSVLMKIKLAWLFSIVGIRYYQIMDHWGLLNNIQRHQSLNPWQACRYL